MSFHSIEGILEAIEKLPGWTRQQQYRRLLQCWDQVVSPKVAANTRPLYIARQVLSVATSNSVWAQTLTMQRYQLLRKLNALLPHRLKDIRFSPTLKSRSAPSSRANSSPSSLKNHPSWVEGMEAKPGEPSLPLCPGCQAPTPGGELQRWGMCCHCVAHKWGNN